MDDIQINNRFEVQDPEGTYTSGSGKSHTTCEKMTDMSQDDEKEEAEEIDVDDDDQSSDEEVFVPLDLQVDGRKREAKRLKNKSRVPKEEINLEKLVRDYQNSNRKI